MLPEMPPVNHSVNRLAPDLVVDARIVLCDLDGCLISERQAYGDSAAFVDACGERLWLISNNSTHCAHTLSVELAQIGIAVAPDRILLAGEQALVHLARVRPNARMALFASPRIEELATGMGIALDDDTPDMVLLCRDTRLSLDRLNAMAAHVSRGAELWVSNVDNSHPGQEGQPIAETGALLAAVRAMVGDVSFHTIGKPQSHLAELALKTAGIAAEHGLCIGDNPWTDGEAARAAGLRFIHLLRDGVPS